MRDTISAILNAEATNVLDNALSDAGASGYSQRESGEAQISNVGFSGTSCFAWVLCVQSTIASSNRIKAIPPEKLEKIKVCNSAPNIDDRAFC
jgi:hypothetical protein